MKDVIKAIVDAWQHERLSQNDVAYMADMEPSRLSYIVNCHGETKLSNLRAIAASFGYRIDFVMVKDAQAQEKLAALGSARSARILDKESKIAARATELRAQRGLKDPATMIAHDDEPLADQMRKSTESAKPELLRDMERAGLAYRHERTPETAAALSSAATALTDAGWKLVGSQWIEPESQ